MGERIDTKFPVEHTTASGETIEVFLADGKIHLGIQEIFYNSAAMSQGDTLWLMRALQHAITECWGDVIP